MRYQVVLPWLTLFLCAVAAGSAAAAGVQDEDLNALFKALDAAGATELPRVVQTGEGFVRYLGAPPGRRFAPPQEAVKSGDPSLTAEAFVAEHAAVFCGLEGCVSFNAKRLSQTGPRSYVRLQQDCEGLPVFAGEMVVQLDALGGVVSLLSDIMRTAPEVASGALTLTPTLTADQAGAAAKNAIAAMVRHHDASDLAAVGMPELMLYDPAVVGAAGPVALVWRLEIHSRIDATRKWMALVDGHTGALALHYSLVMTDRVREIYDAHESAADPGELVRGEGEPPSGIEDADKAYDYFGDTYDFYFEHHGRDSIDGLGMTISATVRYCEPSYGCPMANAFWNTLSNRMYFGEGFTADDVVGHELTHGVTSFESQLIYLGESGAINETFSDVWGEFIDLTNGRGDDSDEVRWLLGEDLPIGAVRDMSNPPAFGHPDRVGSPYWIPPSWVWYDYGGVHVNCGVGNKLCYLLTDGDTFNGQTVEPLAEDSEESIAKVADLYYELQTNLLTPASDYEDMAMQLAQATMNLGYSFDERMNVFAAAKAVEIVPETADASESLRAFRATPAYDVGGNCVMALTWNNPDTLQFQQVVAVRHEGHFPTDPSDGVEVYRGEAEQFLDTSVVKQQAYYYALFADYTARFPDVFYAYAVAGAAPADTLSEAFITDPDDGSMPDNPIDLAYTQLMFSPVGAPRTGLGGFYADYSHYAAAIVEDVYALPVAKDGQAYKIPMVDDDLVEAGFYAPFPFFDNAYETMYVSSNGYIAFHMPNNPSVNVPSLAGHFALPRISFLFSNLSPSTSGDIWMRWMDDRVVLTFERVPEWTHWTAGTQAPTNTVQVELFTSGHIRITYQELDVDNVVVGLSDGRGMPIVPADLFPDLQREEVVTDLSMLTEVADAPELPTTPDRLVIDPLPVVYEWADPEAPIEFTVQARTPDPGLPIYLSATWIKETEPDWDRGGDVPFGDNRDGTGTFYWMPGYDDVGLYTIRFRADQDNGATAYQDQRLIIYDPFPEPEAVNLRLRSGSSLEDPARDRQVDTNTLLIAEYTYTHPLLEEDPDLYGEGNTEIQWFRNNAQTPAFTNHHEIPPQATRPGDVWYFVVIPMSRDWVTGEPAHSPRVTVTAQPQVANIDVDRGPTAGGTVVRFTGENFSNLVSVAFGNILAPSFQAISDAEFTAVTPAHAPGPAGIIITTAAGARLIPGVVFNFEDNGQPVQKADVNDDGAVNAADVQTVINAVLKRAEADAHVDANLDGVVDAADIQTVINVALRRY